MTTTAHQSAPRHKSTAFIKRQLAFLWPLSPMLVFYLLGLLIFTAFRTALCIQNFSRVREIEDYLRIFPIGFRMDTMLLCYTMTLPCLALLALPAFVTRRLGWLFSLFFTLMAGIFFFMEIATFPFMAEFDTRPDRLFLEHMVQVREVFGMIFKGYSVSLLIGVGGALLLGWLVFRFFNKLFSNNFSCSFIKRMALLIIAAPLLLLGIRSNASGRPANISTAAFSKSHLVNQLGINSTYSLGYAYYQQEKHNEKAEVSYGKMDIEEILRRVRASSSLSAQACNNPDIPLLHSQESKIKTSRPLNLVIVLEESIGAEHVGCLGGLPLTPNLDRLSKEGLLLTQLYATGTRTVRGIEAILSGFLPTPGE
ncbi:MAG: sulfatase-like hydrolase/transferase, partial [Pseudomonadota bacterium]